MGLDDIAKWLSEEWAVIAHAPITFTASVIVFAFVIWKAVQWQHGVVIGHKDAEISSLKRQLEFSKADESARAVTVSLPQPSAPKPQTFPPAIPAEDAPAPAERIFLSKDLTPSRLMRLCEGKTDIQAEISVQPHIGKWLNVSGQVRNVSNSGFSYIVSVKTGDTGFKTLWLFFREHIDGLESVSIGDNISALGWIKSIRDYEIDLEDCELT